jgi:hypothetical protein
MSGVFATCRIMRVFRNTSERLDRARSCQCMLESHIAMVVASTWLVDEAMVRRGTTVAEDFAEYLAESLTVGQRIEYGKVSLR